MNWLKKAVAAVFASAMVISALPNAVVEVKAAAEPGVTIAPNTDYPDSDADYQVTFRYAAPEGTQSVDLIGGFHFYTEDQLDAYVNGEVIAYTTPYEYKEGMFPTGYAVSEGAYAPYPMELKDGLYEITMPLPGFEYFYDFVVTDAEGKSTTVKDPTNMPFANNGKDAGHSLLWVGDGEHCLEGQEYVYPRTDGQVGEVTYIDYEDVNGNTQTIGVYTPYGYDASKTYPTMYICHGGGGNEVEWFHIGAAANIFDNLIAEGEVEPTVVVSMNNTVYNFERGPSVQNILEKIIPLVEEKFAVSKDPKDRAIGGLSSGASVTCQALLYNVDEFNYYGIWSPSRTLDFVNETLTDEMKEGFLKPANIYVSVGIYDSAVRRRVNVQIDEVLTEVGANHEFFWKNGAHDWGVWRNQLTQFAKDYLWDAPEPGVVIEDNTDYPDSDASYQVTFTYKASSPDVESVSLVGNWTFYTEDQVDVLIGGTDIDYTLPYGYKDGMFNTGYAVGVTGAAYAPIEMEAIGNGFFRLTLPLPGNEYFYGFAENGDVGHIVKDPTNLPFDNDGSDSGWSLIWVGSGDDCLEGQEYIYARDDEQVGTVSFGTYTAFDRTAQPYGIYLPYGYDESKEYPVLYLSHGGGGNEVEWMFIGSAKNIFDNLIAEGEVEPTIVVTMDNTYLGWNMENISNNMRNFLIPTIEEEYAAKADKDSRAFAGLSQGGYTTTSEAVKSPDLYRYFGILSENYRAKDLILEQASEEELQALKGNLYYHSVGWVDNGNGSQDRRGTVKYVEETLLKYAPEEYYFEWKKGAHDWAVWRAQLTTFAKDYLWTDPSDVELGVTVSENTDFPDVPVNNQATFVFKAPTDTESVALYGNFQFVDPADIEAFQNEEEVPVYLPTEFKTGYYNTGYAVSGAGGYIQIPMEKGEANTFSVTLPLPSTEYCYQFAVTDKAGAVTNYKDPTNLPFVNIDSDSGWSLLWVGSAEDALPGQEYIYPNDEAAGTVEYITFTAVDGSEQPLGVYLPYGFDAAGSYPVLYLSHGGGGNEVEWFNIGSANNIFDNLIAEGSLEPTIIVTMDFSKLGFTSDEGHKNLVEKIIPLIEEKYGASPVKEDRAIAGLSAGGQAAAKAMVDEQDVFGYYGVWSPRAVGVLNRDEEGNTTATEEQLAGLKEANLYYVSVGSFDLTIRRNTELGLVETLKENEADPVIFTWARGAHDWGVWREQLTDFAKNYLWKTQAEDVIGIAPNTDFPESDAQYQITFTLKDNGYSKVELFGGFQFYTDEQAKEWQDGTNTAPVTTDLYNFKTGMWPSGYDLSMGYRTYPMTNMAGVWTITVPVPAGEWFYAFNTYTAGSDAAVKVLDPNANTPYNALNGHDNGWSLITIGTSDEALPGQEWVFPEAENGGYTTFIMYTAIDGTQQPLGIHLPADYDPAKQYPVVYVSHGGGGNEVEWHYIGATDNIIDNLIEAGEVEPTIVVTMDNTYFKWNFDQVGPNLMECIIPFMEENYSVDPTPEGRAFCGLSMGGGAANNVFLKYAGEFRYIGIWSGCYPNEDYSNIADKDYPVLMLGAGCVDMAWPGFPLLKEQLDGIGVSYGWTEAHGAHDWSVWRELFSVFAKDYLWETPEPKYTGFKDAEDNEITLQLLNGALYWYENGVKQGVYGDELNIIDEIYGIERGREIYDPVSDAWYWLDACYDGAVAKDKEVWIPYIFRGEDPATEGKWVRYDRYGQMIKGWYANDNGVYYYDLITGAMLKGTHEINGKTYTFDALTGIRQ